MRKHAGMIVPFPVQGAMVAALDDDVHVNEQRERYRVRRDKLRVALAGAGFTLDDSEAGLYLWATRGEDSRATVDWFAARGSWGPPASSTDARCRHIDGVPRHRRTLDAASARLA